MFKKLMGGDTMGEQEFRVYAISRLVGTIHMLLVDSRKALITTIYVRSFNDQTAVQKLCRLIPTILNR